MMAAVRDWYFGLSRREQVLVSVAGSLSAFVLMVFGIILPCLSAIDHAEIALDDAVQRRGRIEATVDTALARKPSIRTGAEADISLIVTQGAAEKGFDLVKSTNALPGQMVMRMERARAPAFLAWLTELETQGVGVQSLILRSGPNSSITVEAQLQQVAK